MTIKEAIQKAIEGGFYDDFGVDTPRFQEYEKWEIMSSFYEYLLDPSFWQALGKSMGWHQEKRNEIQEPIGWLCAWHEFVDHLSEGGDIETFFKDLN